MPKTKSPRTFDLGDAVRVKPGVTDPDFPDIPFGGWAGTITEILDGSPRTYLIALNERTLKSIHPIYHKRCERDGLESDQVWLFEDDLEPDAGGPLNIEQPQQITTKPLSPKDQDDRIRMIFGLTSNDPLPDVDDETLVAFHQHLSQNLVFPFTAEHGAEYGHPEPVKVIGLGDPEDDPMIDDMYGILCEARMEGQIVTLPMGELEDAKGKPNRQLVEDYCYWFHNLC